ncbi:Type 1 glutamine amidotransferase-like domain-containing protein [Pedobacter sp. KR3-3]|uniref:Type 1 glutamine amidotransferase-like domain-containing protein n=1 Tax=Pedobacter albus TaxID=3113905 RepID=A0ABU7I2Q8_9SPHI|nr:Type 1 glutamine amidotransferase-like domain-containing protein [Pedobacter sp. KR3-3]MEE1943741.1 Type 1 glutamine amidotransferase-like domain-containing protein [Pedobacter sp. KR3-3]
MNLYLSSYLFGNETDQLAELLPPGAKIGHINNAKDWIGADEARKREELMQEMAFLEKLGFENEHVDLKDYFFREEALDQKLATLDGVWVSGGNTFVLRQAMQLSGFDTIFQKLRQRRDFLWAGYSAGVCILCDSLKYIAEVDDPNQLPYEQLQTPIYAGLGYFDYGILPHYQSNHFESEAMAKEVQKCIDNKWLFKALRDGEVLIIKE